MRRKIRNRPGSGDQSGADRPTVAVINTLARRQHGLVTRAQLRALGMRPRAIDRRLEGGRLARVRRGVYRVGPIAQPLEAEMAAILTCGPEAVLSHDSAAGLHQILPRPAGTAPVHVTVGSTDPGPKPRVRIHRTRHLPADEVTRRSRIPATTPARTILDLAAVLRAAALEQAVADAHRRRLMTPRALRVLIDRYPGRPGAPALRSLVEGDVRPAFTRSKAERRLLELIRRAGLDEPHANAIVAGYEVDLHWPEHALVVEVDGPTFHSTRPDRRRDQARDAELALSGITVIRLDPDQVAARPEATVALLARATR